MKSYLVVLLIVFPHLAFAWSFSWVPPLLETDEVLTEGDAADDIAVWVNNQKPSKSLVVGSDKHYGLEIYNLAGKKLARIKTDPVNNVDLLQDVSIEGRKYNLLATSNKTHKSLDLYNFDPQDLSLKLLSRTRLDHSTGSKAYGICLGRAAKKNEIHAFISVKKDKFYQYKISKTDNDFKLQLVRSLPIMSTSEGCVVDEYHGIVYITEEDKGLWAVDINNGQMNLLHEVGTNNLKDDLEGVALYRQENGEGFLVLSSQGNHSYAVFDRKNPEHYLTSFSVGGNPLVDPTSETDGIEIISTPLGPLFPKGIMIIQDGQNTDNQGYIRNQNFKFVSFEEVLKILP